MKEQRRGQAGNILLPIIMMGLVCSLALGALINHTLYLEQAAVDDRLAEIRAYWVQMGHFRYALSRMRHAALCPTAVGCMASDTISDATKVTVFQSYLSEIAAYQTWSYPDENAGYTIKVNVTAAADDDPARNGFSGHLMMTTDYPAAGASTLPVLAGLPQRFTPHRFRFCTSLTTAAGICGPIGSNNNGGRPTGFYAVKRFYRERSVS